MTSPLVSIIVPFYNPKNYFNELLESLSNQSYKNIEIVLIDDGSDKIYNDIAKKFVSLAENRTLITRENGGVASARQAGLEASTGELIIHADADDLVPQFAIERLVEKMVATNADVVVGGYVVKYAKHENYVGVSEDESYWGFVEGLLSGKYHGSLWNKLIKRSLYNAVSFESGLNYMEDKLILAKIFRSGPYVISYVDEAVYVYRQNSGSITYDMSIDSIRNSVVVTNKIVSLYENTFNDVFIKNIIKRQRVFEVLQSASKNINILTVEDDYLLKGAGVTPGLKFDLWIIRNNLFLFFKFVLRVKLVYRSLLNR